MRWRFAFLPMMALAGCSTTPRPALPVVQGPVQVQILAINDFHGNLEASSTPIEAAESSGGTKFKGQLGGAAQLATTLRALRFFTAPNTITVAAGDLIGASPLVSAHFLDEPTIEALSMAGLELASVGNHEFDKGSGELLRMQQGGCQKFTARVPCGLGQFKGAGFQYLGANALKSDGTSLLPPTALRQVGPLKIGFIGMTLKETGNLVTPSGVSGLHFAGEADTANALVPTLKAEGADLIVLLLHQGGKIPETYVQDGCTGLSGEILPILDRLDPEIRIVISGHTHNAYACEVGGQGRRRLLTSAGKNGYLVTDIRLTVDPATRAVLGWQAKNATVDQSQGKDENVAALVDRYASAVAPVANRIIGRLSAPATRDENDWESPASDLIADAMLAATRAPEMGSAQIALVNVTGVRVALPGGNVRYADAFSMMPFGNNLVVMTLTGAQLKTVIEQQFAGPTRASGRPAALGPSAGFTYSVNLRRPSGERVVAMSLNGKAIDPGGRYRVVVNNYLASGGDGLSGFTEGTELTDKGIVDLDALVEWVAKGQTPPTPNRVKVVG